MLTFSFRFFFPQNRTYNLQLNAGLSVRKLLSFKLWLDGLPSVFSLIFIQSRKLFLNIPCHFSSAFSILEILGKNKTTGQKKREK